MYSLSYGPLEWTLPAEVYPSSVRAKGVGLSVATNWLSNFVIGLSVPPMIQGIGFGTYIFFACWCGLAAIFGYFREFTCVTKHPRPKLTQFHSGSGDKQTHAGTD